MNSDGLPAAMADFKSWAQAPFPPILLTGNRGVANMFEVNGVLMFEKGEAQPIPRDICNSISGKSLLGYRIVTGPSGPMWVDATEEDYRQSEAKRLNIQPSAVVLPQYGDCGGTYPTCTGGCYTGSAPNCYAAHNPSGGHFYCGCHSKPNPGSDADATNGNMNSATSQPCIAGVSDGLAVEGSVKVFQFANVQFKNPSGAVVNEFRDVVAVLLLTSTCTLRLTGTSHSNGYRTNPGNYITLVVEAINSAGVELQALEFQFAVPCHEAPLQAERVFDPNWFNETQQMRIPPAHQLYTAC